MQFGCLASLVALEAEFCVPWQQSSQAAGRPGRPEGLAAAERQGFFPKFNNRYIYVYGAPDNNTSQEKEKTGREYFGSTPDGVFVATDFLR